MGYLTNLNWLQRLDDFTPEEQKVMLGLSDDKYKWRTKDRLKDVTGLDARAFESSLAALIKRDLVRPSFSKNKNIIFGLRERVG